MLVLKGSSGKPNFCSAPTHSFDPASLCLFITMPTPILSSFIAVASLCLAVRWVPVEKSIWFWFTFLAFCAAVVRWCHARTIRLSWADQRRAITAPGSAAVANLSSLVTLTAVCDPAGTRGVVPADVSVTHSFFAAPRSGAATCALHVTEFRCENAPARAVVLMLPGYGDHFAAFPGRHAIRLSQAGFGTTAAALALARPLVFSELNACLSVCAQPCSGWSTKGSASRTACSSTCAAATSSFATRWQSPVK